MNASAQPAMLPSNAIAMAVTSAPVMQSSAMPPSTAATANSGADILMSASFWSSSARSIWMRVCMNSVNSCFSSAICMASDFSAPLFIARPPQAQRYAHDQSNQRGAGDDLQRPLVHDALRACARAPHLLAGSVAPFGSALRGNVFQLAGTLRGRVFEFGGALRGSIFECGGTLSGGVFELVRAAGEVARAFARHCRPAAANHFKALADLLHAA